MSKKHEVKIFFQDECSLMCKTDLKLDDEQYKRFRNRQFPITEYVGDTSYDIWLNDKNELHRDGNEPAWITKSQVTNKISYEYWLNGRLHRTNGPALGDDAYCFDGERYDSQYEWQRVVDENNKRRPYFLREKIIALQKLLEIPELYDEVYYTNKNKFLSLLKKV